MPTILCSEAEFNFIMENQRGLSNSQSYSIGGATRAIGNIDYIHYVPYQIAGGENIYHIPVVFDGFCTLPSIISKNCPICSGAPVFVSTQQGLINDNDNFQLTSGNDTLLLHGVLFENGLYLA